MLLRLVNQPKRFFTTCRIWGRIILNVDVCVAVLIALFVCLFISTDNAMCVFVLHVSLDSQ